MNEIPIIPIDDSQAALSSEELISKLRNALSKDGDFPTSAKIVSELRQLTSDPNTTANQITEIILKEPSLGTRVLHLVNSSFYRRSKPIMTVSQAVVQIGMKPLAELCSGLVLLQKFVPAARRGGVFASCLRQMTVTSLLNGAIGAASGKSMGSGRGNECGYLSGTFAEIGTLLLAFYFPQVYEAAIQRSETKNQDLSKSIFDLTGLTPLKISGEVLEALNLPEYYKDVLTGTEALGKNPPAGSDVPKQKLLPEQQEIAKAALHLCAAKNLSESVAAGKNKKQIDSMIASFDKSLGLSTELLKGVLGALPDAFKSHCSLIELDLPALPDYVGSYADAASEAAANADDGKDPFAQYLDEIRQAVDNREPSASVITTIMETLAFGLKFDRVMLLLVGAGKSALQGRMLLGNSGSIDPKKVHRPLGAKTGPRTPDTIAFQESRPIFNGDPLLEKGWPFVVLPIGFNSRAIGVIYADRINAGTQSLTPREQAAIGVLVELLDRSIDLHS